MPDPARIIVPISIREDVEARVQIPVDLTLAEAEKIARVMMAYTAPDRKLTGLDTETRRVLLSTQSGDS